MSWEELWNGIVNFFTVGGLTILKTIGIWIVGYIVIRVVMIVLKKIFSKTKLEKVAQSFFLSIIKFVLYFILLVMVLQQLGVAITGLIAAMSAVGLAIGLALQNSLANVASGIILLINQPFKEGDFVNINGVEGNVKNVKILTTALVTTDNKIVILPNSTVANNSIINYSARRTRRLEFTFNVDYKTDTALVNKIVIDVMKSNGKVQLEPAPFCALKTFGESSIDFFAHCWVASEDYWDVYYYIMDNVFNEFKRNNIEIPFKQIEVRMKDDKVVMPFRQEKLPERTNEKKVEKEQEETLTSFFKRFDPNSKKNKEKREKYKAERIKKKAEKQNKKEKIKLEKQKKSKQVKRLDEKQDETQNS